MVGIELRILRELVFEVLREEPKTQFVNIVNQTAELAKSRAVFPSEEYCQEHDITYRHYREGGLHPADTLNIHQIIWDLIVERVLTIGMNAQNDEWPFLRLTDYGHSVANQEHLAYYDPEGYIAILEELAPDVDDIIKQYALEGLRAFRQNLFFASAVMLGAVAERIILLLLEAIKDAQTDEKRAKNISNLLEYPSLPKIFETIQSTLESLIKEKAIPYSIHEGSSHYLVALFEMVRVHRNSAVHVGEVSRTKVFLTIQALPAALEVTYRLIDWFNENQI